MTGDGTAALRDWSHCQFAALPVVSINSTADRPSRTHSSRVYTEFFFILHLVFIFNTTPPPNPIIRRVFRFLCLPFFRESISFDRFFSVSISYKQFCS